VVGEASDPIFQVINQAELPPSVTSLGVQKDNQLITYVGGFGPHKNLLSLISTFAELISQSEYRDVKLVLVGEYKREVFHTEINSIQEVIRENEIHTNVVFTGYLSDEELVNLLNLSTALVLPSLMEGFGLPAVEAAACGCPVIATNESPLPELLGDGGLYIDPRNPNELKLALERVLGSEGLQNRMRAAGLKAVQSLTWKKAAHQMMEVINQAVIQ
jgi:glycosyltransferase involved in cell wall biosynthesis